MWLIILLLQLEPQLTHGNNCPSSCMCNMKGAVQCVGNIDDIPSPMPITTYLLQMDKTAMKVLNERSLQSLTLMLSFSISNSPLDTIHPEAFNVAPQLLYVKLSSNALSTFPPGVFSRLALLQQLHLNENRLESIDSAMFEGLVSLTELDLSKNIIARLDAHVFQSLGSLRFLNLGKNLLRELPRTVFHSLSNLQYLMLYSNELETLEAGAFDDLRNLLELKLHSNQIRRIPPRLFWSVPYLMTLTMSSNQLQYIPEESFYHLHELKKLTLYKNPLVSLPDQLMGYMPKLKELYLYDTDLTTIPWNLFANMTGLETLNVHLNEKLRVLPKDLFCCQPNLYKLSLKNNNLEDLHPDLFSSLTNLTILVLNNNKLQSLPETIFHNLKQIASIELHENQLQYLPGDVFMAENVLWPALTVVTLGDNPWNCGCSIIGLAEWISHNQGLIRDKESVLCQAPLHLQNHTLGSLTKESLQCDVTTHHTAKYTMTTAVAHTEPLVTQSHSAGRTTEGTGTIQVTTSTARTERTTESWDIIQTNTTTAAPSTYAPDPPTSPFLIDEDPIHSQSSDLSLTFYDTVVLGNGPEIVHNNRLKGWVYLWTLPPSGPYSGLLMTFHILFVAMGVVLTVASAYALYRLNQAMWELGALAACENRKMSSGRMQRFQDKL